jgi:hypothetical protein
VIRARGSVSARPGRAHPGEIALVLYGDDPLFQRLVNQIDHEMRQI